MNIAEMAEREAERTERRAELDSRDREHGGTVPSDRVSEEIRRAVAGWADRYRPSTNPREVRQALENRPDAREVTIGRLLADCRRAAQRWHAGRDADDREAIATSAALLLLRWPSHGDRAPLDLGGSRLNLRAAMAARAAAEKAPTAAAAALAYIATAERTLESGSLPLRRDWIAVDPETGRYGSVPTAAAWRALHAATKQASRDRQTILPALPAVGDALDIAALVDAERIASGARVRLPDMSAPDALAESMGLPLDAARAIVARAFPDASNADHAAAWRMTPAAVAVALSRGAAIVRKRHPDGADLLAALAAAAADYRASVESAALLALIDYRDGYAERDAAAAAVADWRGAAAGLSDHQLALLSAARRACQRGGRTYGAEHAERVAGSVPRLLAAEQSAARRPYRVKRYGALNSCAESAQRAERPHLAPETAQRVAADREALRALLESGSSDAGAIRALRASIAERVAGAQVRSA